MILLHHSWADLWRNVSQHATEIAAHHVYSSTVHNRQTTESGGVCKNWWMDTTTDEWINMHTHTLTHTHTYTHTHTIHTHSLEYYSAI
jgi:hypothetical protein